ncbi:aminotransferase class I/II-fold pyridoxal phosphate-dependent enzyme, partial [Nocardia sp. NPDC004722]
RVVSRGTAQAGRSIRVRSGAPLSGGYRSYAGRLNQGRAHWPLGTLQLEAIAAVSEPAAVAEARDKAERIAADRAAMIPRLAALGIEVHEPAHGPFLLIRVPDAELLRKRLADKGIAVRRGDTFPGLETGFLRVAVRPAAEVDRLVAAIRDVGL